MSEGEGYVRCAHIRRDASREMCGDWPRSARPRSTRLAPFRRCRGGQDSPPAAVLNRFKVSISGLSS